jgi:hypothetical protein
MPTYLTPVHNLLFLLRHRPDETNKMYQVFFAATISQSGSAGRGLYAFLPLLGSGGDRQHECRYANPTR